MFEYFSIIIIFFFALLISLLILFLNTVGILKSYDVAKVAVYECGFDPIDDAREKFDIIFYMIAILFIIFDIEIMFMFPWALALSYIGLTGYVIMIIFLILITIGFFFEWVEGALEWR